ncbi:MAG: ACT domain-containing protein [Planctomycetota bacterium]|nr:ACT domain-containing protein [Planctomycetota bacterium]
MNAETDLATLIRNLEPRALPATYVFCSLADADYGVLPHTSPLASFAEPEGLTLVLTRESADQEGLAYQGTFRCIILQVHSSLEAVGLTAAVTGELSAEGISANVIAGYHHDHIFVPSRHADLALSLLKAMSSRQ